VCLYTSFIDIQKPCSFSQLDIDTVRMWMVHAMVEDGKQHKKTDTIRTLDTDAHAHSTAECSTTKGTTTQKRKRADSEVAIDANTKEAQQALITGAKRKIDQHKCRGHGIRRSLTRP
jgi:hypothetical protein